MCDTLSLHDALPIWGAILALLPLFSPILNYLRAERGNHFGFLYRKKAIGWAKKKRRGGRGGMRF
jgi:hypothetical protein